MRVLAIFSMLAVFSAGCATGPQLSPQQRRAMQMRTFEGSSYDNVFRAFKTVLQDEGYIIKNQDMAGGLILATIQKTAGGGGAFFAVMGGNNNYRTGEGYETSVNIEKISEDVIETRLTVQKLEQYNLGGQQGHEILDPKIYVSIYNKVKTEVERRKAAGKK